MRITKSPPQFIEERGTYFHVIDSKGRTLSKFLFEDSAKQYAVDRARRFLKYDHKKELAHDKKLNSYLRLAEESR